MSPSMYVSALDLFSIGIGPSSSHTVGPMRAAHRFANEAALEGITGTPQLTVTLMGSLGATGMGHGTPDAVLAGLRGLNPETCSPLEVHGRWESLPRRGDGPGLVIELGPLDVEVFRDDLSFAPFERHSEHPNAMRFDLAVDGAVVASEIWLSTGGGFVQREGVLPLRSLTDAPAATAGIPFSSADDLLNECARLGVNFADIAWSHEAGLREPEETSAGLDAIWRAMDDCVEEGLSTRGILPGSLRVPRRAAGAQASLLARGIGRESRDPSWLNIYAMAVNEQNAAGGRVVTAPTNGAAGILPAVLKAHLESTPLTAEQTRRDVHAFLLTAAVIGSLIKARASISGAEAGCQGEVGSACAMAAAGLCAVLGGTPRQVENAAEVAVEHHLGLTCDPVGGLVQIPCIERNAVASSTAQTAARLALLGDGTHMVSLDVVIETMRQTGVDMSHKYKETSLGGLAVNVVEC
ncbi:MAG: serine ammonia-lyase [Microbacteriaceae bacterium]|nr:serine ammonia-lyase [Microbacteriaceae bacterium]